MKDILFNKRQRFAFFGSASGAADAVDIVVICRGKVIVDDVRDIVDVESSGGDVGGDQNLDEIVFELFEGALALALGLVAVNGLGFEATLDEFFGKLFHAVFGPAEDKHFFEIGIVQDVVQNVDFVHAFDLHDVLLHIFGSGLGFDGDGDWIFQKLLNQIFDGSRHSGGETESMPLGWDIRHDELDVIHKPHIKHLVRFVENDRFHFAEFQNSSIDEIEHSSRRADDQVVFVSQVADLHIDVGAADAADGIEPKAFGKNAKFLVDLKRQFAGRGHNENLLVFFVRDLVDERNEKGGCFSGARVGEAHDVSAVQNMKDDFVLDGSRLFVAAFFQSLKNCWIELEIGKLMFGNEMFHFFRDDRGFVDERREVERRQFESGISPRLTSASSTAISSARAPASAKRASARA